MGDSNKQPVESNARGELTGSVSDMAPEPDGMKKKPLAGLGNAIAGLGAAFDQQPMGRPSPAGPQLGAPVNQAQGMDPAANDYIKQLQLLAQQQQGGPYFG